MTTTNPTPTEQDETLEPPERIWINNPAEVTEHDQRWWYENPMAFPTIEYVRAPVAGPRGDESPSAMWTALKDECCKVPAEAQQIVFLSEEKFRKALAPFTAATSSPTPAETDGSMTPEQLEQAALIAGSCGIDLETAQELVYLRDRYHDARALGHLDGLREAAQLSCLTGAISERIKLAEAKLRGIK